MAEPFIIPTVGSSGYFQLREPFNNAISPGVVYTCQEVRRLSGYFANNEDPKTDIYDLNKIPEDIYQEDLDNDAYIMSLQAEMGQWIHVPVRYNIAYPSTNGIPYRSIAFSIGLPAFPANRDFSHVEESIKNLIKDTLGVNSTFDIIDTSKITLVDSDKHELKQISRNMVTGGTVTDRSRYMRTLQDLTTANEKIAALEAWIKANHRITP